jgi:hypothetical protein
MIKKLRKVQASCEEYSLGLAQEKEKMVKTEALLRALVARNFCWTCSVKRGQ